jgi:hypothetical protein
LFLTHPRNAGRTDLGCPFGCRRAHAKERDTKRTVEYYRGRIGKMIKRELNNRRNKKGQVSKHRAKGKEKAFDEKTIKYLQTIISLIEGRPVSQKEILSMLAKKMRQHSIDIYKKARYDAIYYRIRPP